MKVIDNVNARNVFLSLTGQKMPSKVAYKIARFLRETDVDSEFYQKRIAEIANEFGEKNDNGQYVRIDGNIKVRADLAEKFKYEMDVLYSVDSSVSPVMFEIEDFAYIEMSVEDMLALSALIVKEA